MNLTSTPLFKEKNLIPVKIVSVYLLWKVFHHFALIPGTNLNHVWLDFVYHLGSYYAKLTSLILSLFAMKASANGIAITLIDTQKQVLVQDHCLAIPAMVIFIGAVSLFKGGIRDKIAFIAVGLVGIAAINTIRLIFVSLAWVYLSPYFFHLHHSVIYVVLTYGFIFFMIARWMDRVLDEKSHAMTSKVSCMA